MKSLRVPSWLSTGVLDRYLTGASHLFLLHGNVRDVHPFGEDWVPLVEGLKRLTRRRGIVVTYDVSSGLGFPDAEREKALRKALGLRGALPADPARALVVLDALLTTERCPAGSVAVVIDYAHALAPAGASGAAERQNVTTLARWASDPKIAARRRLPPRPPVRTSPTRSTRARRGRGGGDAAPDLDDWTEFARHLRVESSDTAELTPVSWRGDRRPSLVQMEDVVQRSRGAGASLGRAAVVQRKVDLLREEYGDVLEILQPKHDLSAVGGLEHATRELKEVSEIMRRGQYSAAPMGIILMGPPGTGKSYLAECFARECGMLCVRFRPLRQMYVGQSERNQEKAFAAIRALAPVVVLVDESDQAEGGSRDQGSGDSGVTERMRGSAFSFWGDSSLRGRVLRIDITNRVDLIDAAMRRSGRTDIKIPILMPDEEARRQIFEVTVRKHKLASAIKDYTPFARRTEGYTGSDIELALTTAWRFALRDGAAALTDTSRPPSTTSSLPRATSARSTT
jgi:hypothetical protein